MSRWQHQEECTKRCGDCTECWEDAEESTAQKARILSKKYVTVGSVRYGIRLGAVSPPPPGFGPRYRSQCCWHFAPGPDTVSQHPLLPASHINSRDIFRCVNRVRMAEDATSELSEQAIVCDQVLYSTRSLLRNQLSRRRAARSPAYARLCDCRTESTDTSTNLDRLPRFRFGGNRGTNNGKVRDKKDNEQRLREITDRLKRGPVPPPRTRHVLSKTQDTLPTRSASFSQVDYSTDDNKYVRRRPQTTPQHNSASYSTDCASLPRAKTNPKSSDVNNVYDETPEDNSDEKNQEEKKAQEKKRDKSRRRKGMYISQWPDDADIDDNSIINQLQDCNFMCNDVQDSSNEIPKLQVVNSDTTPTQTIDDSNAEPTSPDDNKSLEWPNVQDQEKPEMRKTLLRVNSFSESESDQIDRRSDISDTESRVNPELSQHITRRYSKRPLRGPYGQMLEAEMKKPETGRKNQYSDLKFLDDIKVDASSTLSLSPRSSNECPKYLNNNSRSKISQSQSIDDSQIKNRLSSLPLSNKLFVHPNTGKRKISADNSGGINSGCLISEPEQKLVISHQRTTSSPSKLEGFSSSDTTNELDHLLRGSSEQLILEAGLHKNNDTRTHVVVELYDTERSYVESLQVLVTKYLEPLKNPENAGLLDTALVDEIFFQVPSLLSHHQIFLEELQKRLEQWDIKQKLGDLFIDMFSKQEVIETYTNYVNNWKRAREIIKNAQQSKPAFARFIEAMAREHKGKLALDSLLIKPIQKFPKYELLLQRLLKHTDPSHPDHSLLLSAQREIHEQLLKINCTEREAVELEQLREIEGLIDGLMELVSNDRQYLRHDLVNMTAGSGTRKERALFLFSDLLLVTSIKRRSGTIKRPLTGGQGTVTSTLEANKYKLLMKVPLQDLEIVRAKDENLRQMIVEIENLTEDISVLNQINDMAWSLHSSHAQLDEIVKEMLNNLNKQLIEQQNSDSQLSCLDLMLNTTNGPQNISVMFLKPDKRASWEEAFNEAKHKLAISGDKRPCPELVTAVPIRKTRAGLQFTCAAPTIGDNGRDVWVCNSDGYVGQVCILSLQPEPTVTSCNGVCNARILCITSVPALNNRVVSDKGVSSTAAKEEPNTIQFDSSSSSDEDKSDCDEQEESKYQVRASVVPVNVESEEGDVQQSTMWLGTEDGCIHIYNSSDNIRIKKNKYKLQHGSAILCIIYLDNRVFVSLANGDVIIYERDLAGGWNTTSPLTVAIGTANMPVSKMISNVGKLWCGCGNTVKIVNIQTFTIENVFTVNNDSNKPINGIVVSGNGVWLSLQNSSVIKCYHAVSFEFLCELNIAPAVTKMLTSCDDIIRQHKAACLRVTSLLACKELLWIGTSAGVILTVPLPHIHPSTIKLTGLPNVVGVPHGHTGHVRFLTNVEWHISANDASRHSYKPKPEQRNTSKHLVISGGDGYEDFRNTNLSEVAGREDSTNHLLLWNI